MRFQSGGWQRFQSVSWWLAFFDPVCVLLNPGSPSYLRRHSLLRLFGDKLSLERYAGFCGLIVVLGLGVSDVACFVVVLFAGSLGPVV